MKTQVYICNGRKMLILYKKDIYLVNCTCIKNYNYIIYVQTLFYSLSLTFISFTNMKMSINYWINKLQKHFKNIFDI